MFVNAIIIIVSAILGWGFGYTFWYVYPQSLILLGIWSVEDAAISFSGSPPLYFQLGWTLVGILYIKKISFVNKIISKIQDTANLKNN